MRKRWTNGIYVGEAKEFEREHSYRNTAGKFTGCRRRSAAAGRHRHHGKPDCGLVQQGYSAEEIADQYPQLALAQVCAALAYYHANTVEVEAALAAEQHEAEASERQQRQSE